MPNFDIYPATVLSDLERLRPVLQSAIRHPFTKEVILEEVEETLQAVEKSRRGDTSRYYAIAHVSGGAVVGMMGLKLPDETMSKFAATDNPIEIINAFVLASTRGSGVGRNLVRHLEDKAKSDGHTEIVVNSGPRYMLSGWPFWRRMYGEHVGMAQDYYGPRLHARVWRKTLDQE